MYGPAFYRGILNLLLGVFLAGCVTCVTTVCVGAEEAAKTEPASRSSWTQFRGNAFATGFVKDKIGDELKELWKYEVDKGAFESTPIILDGICYAMDLDGVLHTLDLNTGELRWKKKTNAFSFAASPALTGDRLFVGDIDGLFYCFDLQGNEKWRFESQAEINSSASFYDGKVLFGSQDATLYCLDQTKRTNRLR